MCARWTEDCPNNFVGLIDRMKQGKFTTESENVGVVHPTIKSTIKSDTGEPLGVILSEMKVSGKATPEPIHQFLECKGVSSPSG